MISGSDAIVSTGLQDSSERRNEIKLAVTARRSFPRIPQLKSPPRIVMTAVQIRVLPAGQTE